MESNEVSIEDLKAINHFSKIMVSSQTFIGNHKKGICENIGKYGSGEYFCNAWSWEDHKFSGLNRHFAMGEPIMKNNRLFINPEPLFCSICPKWFSSKEATY
jgi:hypothetical protein